MENRIRFYREKAGLTQARLAKHLGVEQPTVASLEKSKNPGIQTIAKVVDRLNQFLNPNITISDIVSNSTPSGDAAREQRKIIAIAGEKGGVGKSTIAYNLACFLSQRRKKKTILIDLDSQQNSTYSLIDPLILKGRKTIWNLFSEYDPNDKSRNVRIEEILVNPVESLGDLQIAPAHRQLSRADLLFSFRDKWATSILSSSLYESEFENVVIDCPGNLGILTLNALNAATDVIIPSLVGDYEAKAIADMMDTLNSAKKMNPGLNLKGVVLNRVIPRRRLNQATEKAIKSQIPVPVFKNRIGMYDTINLASNFKKPVFLFSPKDNGSKSMLSVLEEIIDV